MQKLWKDYLFLTKEMGKFLDKHDLEMFFELLEQRQRLQDIIETTDNHDFPLSASGRELLQCIEDTNQIVTAKLQFLINNSRNQENLSRAYENMGAVSIGKRMDWQS